MNDNDKIGAPLLLFTVFLGFLCVFLVSLAIRSFADSPEIHETRIASEKRILRLVEFDEPKHVYAYFMDMDSGDFFNYVYVSKHCNSWRENVKIGGNYELDVDTVQRVTSYKGRNTTNIVKRISSNLYAVFCH